MTSLPSRVDIGKVPIDLVDIDDEYYFQIIKRTYSEETAPPRYCIVMQKNHQPNLLWISEKELEELMVLMVKARVYE